ncbi:MAG: aminotransferase class I/II-fold pyridoxal phosphate-dependent enzyme [Desulfobacteraceae bacterium]|nr:aminotransferase class I/II-fold pyridoxal phosphate-dependent enzyme [Desulfobacteraceae bacterium]
MRKIKPFAIERYFSRYEFSARYLLSCSDCEPYAMADILEMADPEIRKLWDNLSLSYTETTGHPLLRDAIAATYDGIGPEDVLVMAPEEAIFLAMHALLSPGDHVVCTFPGYQSLYEIARSIGCELSFWKADEAWGWEFCVQDLAELVRKDTRLVIANFPHNPTGFVPSQKQYSEIIDLTKAANAYLFSDEMYRCLEFESRQTLPAACTRYENAVSLSGLSKAYGLPGLRTGWLATRNQDVRDRVSRLRDYTTICGSAPGEILSIIALHSRDRILGDQLSRVRKNAGLVASFVSGFDQFLQLSPAMGGSICFPRVLSHTDTTRFCKDLVEETGIMLVPSSLFDYGDRHVRIGFGREDLPQVLDRFGAYLADRYRDNR